MKISNDTIGNRPRNLMTSSTVPQPTAPPRGPKQRLCEPFHNHIIRCVHFVTAIIQTQQQMQEVCIKSYIIHKNKHPHPPTHTHPHLPTHTHTPHPTNTPPHPTTHTHTHTYTHCPACFRHKSQSSDIHSAECSTSEQTMAVIRKRCG